MKMNCASLRQCKYREGSMSIKERKAVWRTGTAGGKMKLSALGWIQRFIFFLSDWGVKRELSAQDLKVTLEMAENAICIRCQLCVCY